MVPVTLGFYDESRSRGGTTRYLLDLLACLDRSRYQPVFFALRPYEWHSDLRALDIPLHFAHPAPAAPQDGPAGETTTHRATPGSRLPQPVRWSLGMAQDVRALSGLWKRHPVDALHINICGTEPAPIAARLAGLKRIVGVYHISPSYDLEGKRRGQPYRGLETWALRSLDAAIACSRFTQADWEARFPVPKGLMTTVQNGIDLSRGTRTQSKTEARASLGFKADDLLIGCVANLHPYKGHTFLIEAFGQTVVDHPRARLVLAGSGALEASLKEQARNLGDRITFLGYCGNVRGVLEALDVYVQPSVMEALGLAVLEASAMGLPVVASEVGGLPEVVRPGETGLLVSPGDPSALAEALARLLDHSGERELFGSTGSMMVREQFTRERMAAETCAVYERLLARSSQTASSTGRLAL